MYFKNTNTFLTSFYYSKIFYDIFSFYMDLLMIKKYILDLGFILDLSLLQQQNISVPPMYKKLYSDTNSKM